MTRLVVCALAAVVLTGCAKAGPPRVRTELELKAVADHRACKKETLGYGFIPYIGQPVRSVEFDKCMLKLGWDIYSARDRVALYGAPDGRPDGAPNPTGAMNPHSLVPTHGTTEVTLPPVTPAARPVEPVWDTGL